MNANVEIPEFKQNNDESMKRLQANILDSITDAVFVVSAEGQVSYWNDGAVQLFGVPRAVALGKSLDHLDHLVQKAPFSRMLRQAAKIGRTTLEFCLQTEDRRTIWVLGKATLMRADEDNHVGCLFFVKDISERKLIEVERERITDKLREFDRFKSEFLATASHEMRTPLTIIREFANLMADRVTGPTTQDQSVCLAAVLRNCDRMTFLLDDLLDLAKIESGKLVLNRESIDLAEVLRESTGDFVPQCARKSQSLLLELGEGLPHILGDRSKIGQALVNLIGNASKFTPEGGAIVVRSFKQDKNVCVEISDNGHGIAEADLSHIFEAFIQAGREDGPGARGTGLGLTITREIVNLHGGEISVKSSEGIGTTFRFELPIYSSVVP